MMAMRGFDERGARGPGPFPGKANGGVFPGGAGPVASTPGVARPAVASAAPKVFPGQGGGVSGGFPGPGTFPGGGPMVGAPRHSGPMPLPQMQGAPAPQLPQQAMQGNPFAGGFSGGGMPPQVQEMLARILMGRG